MYTYSKSCCMGFFSLGEGRSGRPTSVHRLLLLLSLERARSSAKSLVCGVVFLWEEKACAPVTHSQSPCAVKGRCQGQQGVQPDSEEES